MSIKALGWAWRQRVQSPLQKLSLILLADMAGDMDTAVVDYHDLAQICETTEPVFADTVQRLAVLGLVEINHDAGSHQMRSVRLNLNVERIG